MARHPSGKPWKAQVGVKLDQEIVDEIQDLAEANYSFKSKILQEIINLGLVEFKKENPKMEQQLNDWRQRNKPIKAHTKESKHGPIEKKSHAG